MSVVGPRMKQEVDDALDFIIKNLKEQYVIPACAKGSYSESYDYDEGNFGVESKLTVTITVKNMDKCTCDNFTCGDPDYLNALGEIATVIVQDNLEFDKPGNRRPDHQCLNFFGCKSISHTDTRELELCGNRFLVSVIYTRSYCKLECLNYGLSMY